MKVGIFIRAIPLLCIICALFGAGVQGQDTKVSLDEVFTHPPESAKPRVYWLWPHGNFDYTTIRKELMAFKDMGIGGADIFDMGIQDRLQQIPPGNVFMGDRMLDGIEFADRVARDIDFALGLSVSNGWNAGGDWTEPDEMIMQLLFWKDTLTGPVHLSEIGFPELPRTFSKPYGTYPLYPQFDKDQFPLYYKNVGLIAYPFSEDGMISDPESIIFFNEEEIDRNSIDIELPEGKWILTRAVVCPLGQKQWMQSDRSDGFIMDHYSVKATQHHFNHIISRLESRLGSLEESALERLYLASFEAEDYIIWSPELAATFRKQHGYDILGYVPVLAGQTITDESISQRFLYDYRLTVSEMFVNNHYRQAKRISNEHHLLLASESGGPGLPLHYVPTEDLKALGAVDVMRGEFWNKESEYFDENGNDLLQVVKNIASAAHIYGHKVVEMEAFTSHGRHWDEQPTELKVLADRAFCEGMTRVVYHTSPHSPKEAGVPGWSYQAGTHISPKMAWWELSEPFHSYLSRSSALLQEGQFVADAAYYYGEQIPNFASGSKHIRETLGVGYDYDDLNKEVLLQSSATNDGKLLLPSGMQYSLLVLPEDTAMSLEVLEKVKELLESGITVLGDPPSTVWGLKDYIAREKELKALVQELWGKKEGKQKRRVGKGWLYSGYDERSIFSEKSILPDFLPAEYSHLLDYIHRTTGHEDIYFIRNSDSIPIQTTVDFRIDKGLPYQFDPATGSIIQLAVYEKSNGRTQVPIKLNAYGSTFLVFKKVDHTFRHIVGYTVDGKQNSGVIEAWYENDGLIQLKSETGGTIDLEFSDGAKQSLQAEGNSEIELEGPWTVHFPHGWGFAPIQQFKQLTDWSKHPDPELAGFSGLATYQTTFRADKTDGEAIIDLGRVAVAARLYLNGKEVGTRVFAPFRFDITEMLRKGENHLAIEVASTWRNKLISDSAKPAGQQNTNSNLGTIVLNETGREEIIRPWKDLPAQESGLIGPVRIILSQYSTTEKP